MQGSSNSSLVSPSMAPAQAPPVPCANNPPARRVVVAHRLPLCAAPDPDSPFGFAFSLDPDALPLQLSHGLPTAVIFVGTLPDSAASVVPSDEFDDYLMEKFSCLPVHLDRDCHTSFYDRFCKRYLWPQLHSLLPVASAGEKYRFDDAAYRAFIAANKQFADRLIEVLSPDDGGLVIVHDYHLWLLPTILRHKCPPTGVGFFLHSPFPSSDVFRNIPVSEDLICALLNADLVGFQTFDYAGQFLSSCSRILGISSHSCRGHIGIDHNGRNVLIKVLPVGIDMAHIRGAMASPGTAARAREITESYGGRKLLIGVDDADILKGVSKKFQAMDILLETCADLRGQVVLVQINNPARSPGADVDGVLREMDQARQRINSRYGCAGYTPVVMIDGPVPMSEKVAYYSVADCCVVSAVRDGLNRIPYFYTLCREEGPAAAAAQRTSVVVVSEFVGCSSTLGGAIRVNPFSEVVLAEAMLAALTMRTEEKQSRHRRNYSFLAPHDVVAWARSFDASLQVACRDLPTKRFVGLGFGMSYRAVASDKGFKKLAPEHASPAYRAAARRLIVLEYDGTLVPDALDETKMVPNAEVTRVLNELCSDPMNVVFLVSDRSKDQLAEWFSPCEKLGISAEHGYFTRWSRDDPWETSKMVVSGFAWKESAEELMKQYTEFTDGSYMENTESSMVWHYENADPILGPCQAMELFDHLKSFLAKEPVSVTRGSRRQTVEVKPQGVTKGAAVESLISAMKHRRGGAPDFVLCVGYDEHMFEALARVVDDENDEVLLPAGARVLTCTIGLAAPSKAAFYLDGAPDVLAVLRGMLGGTTRSSSSSSPNAGLFEIVSLASGSV